MAELLHTLHLGEPPIKLVGYSVAGEETVVGAPELDVLFDVGKAPRALLNISHVCLTHGHMDHAAGVAYYFWQRDFQENPGGTVLLPAALEGPVANMLRAWSVIEGHLAPHKLVAMRAGQRHQVRRDLLVEAFDVAHGRNVPCLGYVVLERRRKLRAELAGLTGPEIVARKRRGEEVTTEVEVPLVAYLGDTELFDFTGHRLVAGARILVVECTFFDPEHRSRAKAGFHMHLDDLPRLLEMTAAQAVVLTHLTRRTSLRQARAELAKKLTDQQRARVHFLMERQQQQSAVSDQQSAISDQQSTEEEPAADR